MASIDDVGGGIELGIICVAVIVSFRSSDVFSNLENIAEVSLSASSSTSMSSPLTPAPAIPRHSKPQLPTATDNGHPISTSSISTPPFTTTTSYLRDMLPMMLIVLLLLS